MSKDSICCADCGKPQRAWEHCDAFNCYLLSRGYTSVPTITIGDATGSGAVISVTGASHNEPRVEDGVIIIGPES